MPPCLWGLMAQLQMGTISGMLIMTWVETTDSTTYVIVRCPSARQRKDEQTEGSSSIHLGKWRLLTPRAMVDIGYLQDLGVRREHLGQPGQGKEGCSSTSGHRAGGGLEQGGRTQEGRASRPKEKELRKRSRSPRRGKDSMPQFLLQQAAKQGEKKTAPSRKKKKRGSEKKPKREDQDSPEKTSSEESESSSFQLAPAWGGEL